MSAAEAIAPEQSVDKVRQSLSVTDKGKTANTIDNCRIVFCCDPLLRDAIRLNLLTDRVDIVQDLGWRRNTSALTDTDVKYLLLYFERNYELTSEKKITAALSIVANENCYHPIQDVLNSLVWDGTPRIRSCLHHFLGADESDYVEEMLKHFLLGAIRRVFRPGSKYEEMLCLVGGQGAGKSTFFRLLAIRDEWFSDDLKKLDDDRVFQSDHNLENLKHGLDRWRPWALSKHSKNIITANWFSALLEQQRWTEAEETLEQFLHRAKNTQDKLGYHLLREDYARAIGDTELEKQERLLSEQLKTQLGNKKGESRIPASAKESKYAFFCWLSFSVGLALFGIISNIATGDSILGSFGAGVFILGLFSFPVCLIWLILWLIRRRKEAAK